MKAIVLSGGGSKGSYQIGVWKALKKLHIKYDIVTGTSVGALNGALMTQNTYRKAKKLWKNISLKTLFGEDATESENNLDVLKMYKDNIIKNGGMEVNELECLIDKSLNKKRFFNSPINFGLITFNVAELKPVKLIKENISEEKITDYLMASASCYPAFKQKEIEDKKFIDGGIYDNLPINLAIELGADEIIAVDLKAPGIKQSPKEKIPIIKISPNNKLTNFLNFYASGAKQNMIFGYNDTMKVFKKYEGKKFTYKKNTINKIIDKYQSIWNLYINKIITNKTLTETVKKLLKLNNTITEKATNKLLLNTLEDLGQLYKLDETKIYTYKKFNKKLKKAFRKSIKSKEKSTKEELIIELYKKLHTERYNELKKDIILYSSEFLKALYLYSIIEG